MSAFAGQIKVLFLVLGQERSFMKYAAVMVVFAAICSSIVFGQETAREQKLQKLMN